MRRSPIVLAFAALAAVVLSCSDATSPGSTFRVYVTMTSFVGPSFEFGSNGLQLRCEPRFQAIVSGKMAGSWVDAKVLWYVGTDRSKPIDSTLFTKSDVDAAWGASDLIPGDTLVTDWWFTNTLPFRADFVLRYKGPSGPVRTETVGFTCGPTIDSATAAPSVDTPTLVSAPAGDLDPGDTIQVRLVARAPAGLWQTSLRLTGACADTQLFSERLATTNTHTAQFVLSPTCALGQQLDVVASVWDGAGRLASATLSTGRTLVDTRPPTIAPSISNLRTASSAPAATLVRDEVFAGDKVILGLWALDNAKLSRFYWEETTSGQRDSLVLSSVALSTSFGFPVSTTNPMPRFRFWARDAAGLTSDTVTTPAGAITVAPRDTPTARTATIDGDVVDGVYDARRQVVYFAQRSAGRVAVFSLASMSVVSTIALDAPVSVDLVASGDSLVVALLSKRALAIVDLTTPTPTVSTVSLAATIDSAQQAPFAARAMANGKVLVALGSGSAARPTLLTLDLATGAQRARGEVGSPDAFAAAVARTADATVAVITGGCLRRYTAATDTFSACVSAPGDVVPALDASGSLTADGLSLFDATPTLVRQLPTWRTWPNTVGGTALTADGATLLVDDPDLGIVRVRTSDGLPTDASALPFATSRLLRLGSDRSVMAWSGPTTPTSVVVVQLP